MTGLVLAARRWRDNGELISDVARLGYLREDERICDVTYGLGLWWRRWRPAVLFAHDLHKLDGVDFRQLPEPDGCYRKVAWDPPYVAQGGRETSTIDDFTDRYGIDGYNTPATPRALHDELIVPGLDEMWRVLAPGGLVLLKCKDYVTSGRVQWAVRWAEDAAEARGFHLLDRFEHVGSLRAQPQERRRRAKGPGGKPTVDEHGEPVFEIKPTEQKHARRNLSSLLVLRKPGRRPKYLPDMPAHITRAPFEQRPRTDRPKRDR